MHKPMLILSSTIVALTFAVSAGAQPTTDEPIKYTFEDDDLLGDAFFSHGDLVTLRLGPARTLLIRPRTQFVREMLQSVENL